MHIESSDTRPPPRLLRGLILDVDGTLADTEPYHRDAFNQAFREFGLGWHWGVEEYGRLLEVSGGPQRMRAHAELHPLAQVASENLDEFLHDVHKRKSILYRKSICRHRPRLRTGVLRLLQEAKQAHLAVAIATNSSRRNLETLLSDSVGARLLRQFRAVLTADSVPHMKPDPAIYRKALEAVGLTAGHCVAFEDTSAGNRSALRAGLTTVVTAHRYVRRHDFEGAALIVHHLGDPGAPCQVYQGPAVCRQVNLSVLEKLLALQQPADHCA